MTDPYAAPRSSAAATQTPRRPSRAWWLYFGLLCLILAIAMVSSLRAPRFPLTSLLGSALNLWGLVGLSGFITLRPIGPRWQWLICLGLTVLQLVLGTLLFLWVWLSPGWSPEQRVALVGLTGPLLMLPLVYALARYAFSFASLWKSDSAD